MIGVARLNEQGVYLGVEVIEAAVKNEEHIEVPIDCDLTPGRYQWKGGQFAYIAAPDPVSDAPPVVALNALALALIALLDAKIVSLPSATLQWLDFYVRTIDFAISKDAAADRLMLERYIAARRNAR
jgi:hypothetical protein